MGEKYTSEKSVVWGIKSEVRFLWVKRFVGAKCMGESLWVKSIWLKCWVKSIWLRSIWVKDGG